MTDKLLEQLKKPFPKEAHSTDSSRGFDLTSIRAQWVVERLNDVFGVFGWEFEPRYEKEGNNVLCHGTLTVWLDDIKDEPINTRKVKQVGGSTVKKNLADAYKSAATDSLGKCASWLCIGNAVFKGTVDPKTFEEKVDGKIQELVAAIKMEVMRLEAKERSAFCQKWQFDKVSDLTHKPLEQLQQIRDEVGESVKTAH